MPMQKSLYPADWEAIALRLKEAANWTCQRCGAKRGEQQENQHGEMVDVQIGVMHLNHDPWNKNALLQVACRVCHLTYDGKDRRRKRVMMAIARGQLVLPGLDVLYEQPRGRKQRPISRRAQRKRAPSRRRENGQLRKEVGEVK